MSGPPARGQGSLIAVGTGIRVVGQLTIETISWMRRADRLLYVVADPVAEATIRRLNPRGAESLMPLYIEGKPRLDTYKAMVERILECVRGGMLTCAATYGHPGVFANPIHDAIHRARREGYPARMLPAISAEDCLFADMAVDPARDGCQTYEATDFLLHGRRIDPTAGVILWQIGVVGDLLYRADGYDLSLLPALVERLLSFYPPDHVGYVYEAALLPGADPWISPVPLALLGQARLTASSTLFIPPVGPPTIDHDVKNRLDALNQEGRPGAAMTGIWRSLQPLRKRRS